MHVGADVLQTFRLTAVSLTAGVQRSLRHRLTFSQSARAGAALRQPLRQLAGRQMLGAHTFSGCLQHNRAAPRGVSAVQSQGTRGRVVRRRQPRTDHTGAREKARDGKGAQTRAMRGGRVGVGGRFPAVSPSTVRFDAAAPRDCTQNPLTAMPRQAQGAQRSTQCRAAAHAGAPHLTLLAGPEPRSGTLYNGCAPCRIQECQSQARDA